MPDRRGASDLIQELHDLSPDGVIHSLSRVTLFEGLPDDELRALAEIIKGIRADPGDVLFAEGDKDDRFYIVMTGAVEIMKLVPGGGEEKLAVRRAGDVFGEMALLNDAPRFATARVAEACECMTLSRADFEQLIGGDSFALRMLKILSQALRALGVRFVNAEREEADGLNTPLEGVPSARIDRSPPRVDGFDVAGGSAPSSTGVELNAWEELRFSDGRIGLVALGLQGDRVPPIHQVAVTRALCTEYAQAGEPPETLLARVGDNLYRNQVPSAVQFVEAGMLVPHGDTVLWANSGGLQCALLRGDGTYSEFLEHGPPLGMRVGFQPGIKKIPIGSGDMMLVLSGGSRGLFRGAVDAVSSSTVREAGEVVVRVQQAIREDHASQADNVTVLFLRRL